MAKLTRRQRSGLEAVAADLARAIGYVRDQRMALCTVRGAATTTLDFTRQADDKVIYEVDKEIGSNMTGLSMASARLSAFLDHDAREDTEASKD